MQGGQNSPMNNPLVSIIIPYYLGERFIKKTLDSLLQQNYPHLEIIIVSDGSTEASLKPIIDTVSQLHNDARPETIILLTQPNQGQAVARNLGLTRAKGTIIGMIDQDDLWPTNRLNDLIPYLTSGDYDFVRGHTQKLFSIDEAVDNLGPVTWYPVLVGAALYTRNAVDAVGLFDPTLREGEDFDWVTRLEELHLREKRISKTTLVWRQHTGNQSAQKDYIKNGQLLALKRKLARMRSEYESRV